MFVKIKPISTRAKNRVREHGSVMQVEDAKSTFNGKPALLLKSIKEGDDWLGWLTHEEAEFKLVNFTEKGVEIDEKF